MSLGRRSARPRPPDLALGAEGTLGLLGRWLADSVFRLEHFRTPLVVPRFTRHTVKAPNVPSSLRGFRSKAVRPRGSDILWFKGVHMNRFLPAILFTISVAAPSVRADSIPANITYTATEQMTVATPTQEVINWTFTGPQDFSLEGVLAPAPASILDPSEKPGDWMQLWSAGFTGQTSPIRFPDLTFGTIGSFGFLHRRCDSPLAQACDTDEINTFSMTFTPVVTPLVTFWNSDRTLLSSTDSDPVATPEPSSLLLFGSGILALGFAKKFIALAK